MTRSLLYHIYFVCFMVGFGNSSPLRAQEYRFEQLGTPHGLPSSEVYGLHIDNKGYVWAFTNYGIVKHNGERFVKACQNIPFRQSVIYANTEDEKGNFYVANSRAEIVRIKNDSAFILEGLKDLSEEIIKEGNIIYNFSVNDTSILVSTNQFTYYVDLKRKTKYTNITRKNLVDTLVLLQRSPTSYIACNTVTREGEQETVFGQLVNVLLLNATTKKHFKINVSNCRQSRHLIENRNGIIYLMFQRQLFLINTKTQVIKSIDTEKQIINYDVDETGNIWICFYKGGIGMYDPKGIFKKSYFEKVTITDVVFDKLNGIWLSSLENGVFYCAHKYEKHFDNVNSIGADNITCLKACDTTLFVGTMSGNVTLINHKKITSYTLKNTGYQNNDILDIIYYQNQYILGTKNGVFSINQYKISRLSRLLAACKQLFSFHDSVLYLTNRTVEYLKIKPVLRQHNFKKLDVSIICAAYDRSVFVLGTDNGLYTYDLSNGMIKQHSLHDQIVQKIYVDNQHNKWICTKGNGLYKITLQGDTFHINNAPSDFINDIMIRKDSIVILSTNTGLYYTLLNDIDKAFWINIYNSETLNIAFFNEKLFAGTKGGLVSFENTAFLPNVNPEFYLNSIKVNGKERSKSIYLELPYNENAILFDFDYLNFNAYKQLAYELNGPVKLAGISGVTDIFFQNLSPGTYTLSVSPLNHSKAKAVSVSCIFTIKPAFWQTTAFFFSVAICCIIITLLIFLLILRTREKKRRKRFEIEKQLAEQKLTALKAQINPHFISNSLSSIQQLIHTEEIDKAGKYIAMFSVFIRTVLNLSDKLLVPLEEEIKIIELYVELEQLRFTNKFLFIKTISPDIDIYYTAIPPLITQPLIENAIWHGLLQMSNRRQPVLKLRIYRDGKNVIIEIEDNGKGRDLSKTSLHIKDSKGTQLIKNRIENLNKIHPELNASLQIHDLYDEQGEPTGTKVFISMNGNI